jgi:hypothetical protein
VNEGERELAGVGIGDQSTGEEAARSGPGDQKSTLKEREVMPDH